ncbi:MAG: hypothetical protein ACJ71K_10765, partial [Nitrososphaeraceae archaeon]
DCEKMILYINELEVIIYISNWLYYPDIETTRVQPSIIQNIPNLKRKEQSIYKPSDLWTEEDYN